MWLLNGEDLDEIQSCWKSVYRGVLDLGLRPNERTKSSNHL